MKKLLFLISIFCALTTNAQNYQISFAGTGASATVNSVKIENLSTGTSLIINGEDILSLSLTTGINSIEDKRSTVLITYPNPMSGNSILQFSPPETGNAVITVYEVSGKTVFQIQKFLESGQQEFRLSGLNSGYYLINVKGSTYQYSGKVICKSVGAGNIRLEKININQSVNEKKIKPDAKGSAATVDMTYAMGERLKFTGISGDYSTVITDIPTGNKTITFDFMSCTDGDNNNYPVVKIGTQVWMAENLKTTKYRNRDLIPNITECADWMNMTTGAYCDFNNTPVNSSTYGRLYNWYSVKDSRNLCPIGWHVPTDYEWTDLTDYLGGISIAGGKLKETGTTHWKTPNYGATNEVGFTALPASHRYYDCSFDNYLGDCCFFWSSTEISADDAWWRSIGWNNDIVYISSDYSKKVGNTIRCVSDIEGERVLPSLTTTAVSLITATTAKSGGNVSDDNGTPVTAYGVCWNTSRNPTTANSKTTDGAGIGTYLSSINGLTPSFTYNLRAYAITGIGIAYGNEISFTSAESPIIFNPNLTYGSVTDIDGNVYKTIKIGSQVWMAENLRTTRYNDGTTSIANVTENSSWGALISPAYCWYDNNESNGAIYGALYNWYMVSTGKLCPIGWHVSSDTEWTSLVDYLGGEDVASEKLKENGFFHWHSPESGANNATGFTALPGGYRGWQSEFSSNSISGSWWSDKEADIALSWSYAMYRNNSKVERKMSGMEDGLSVRCVKDY